MTFDDFGTVDVDLLADYIGDALDEPERSRVARLVADDPEWRSAHALLAQGMSRVGAELGALGAASEPMPADLGVRLDAAFAADPATGHGLIAPELAEPSQPHLQPSRGDRHLVSVPSEISAKAAPRRRRLRWAAPIAAAAGVLAFAGLGTSYLTSRNDEAQTSAAGSAADSKAAPMIAEGAPQSALVTGPAQDQVKTTGTNYTTETLKSDIIAPLAERNKAVPDPAGARGAQGSPAAPDAAGTRGGQGSPPVPDAAGTRGGQGSPAVPPQPDALDRLRDQTALLACLDAIAQQNAAGPIAVQSVDYALFAGAPALIVRFTSGGVGWAWATGPDCGAPGLGAQARQRVRVG